MRKKIMVANWKMNPIGIEEAEKLFASIKKKIPNFKNIKTIICPPVVFMDALINLYTGSRIQFGAQDAFWQKKGSFTGEVSPYQLKDLGVEYVILGHSERRSKGESNEIVSNKITAAIEAKLNIILCVGEQERDMEGDYLHFLRMEIKESLKNISKNNLGKVIIAYEPIWAIGGSKDKAITAEDLYQTKLFILKTLNDIYGQSGLGIPILYGGSSTPENASSLLTEGQVQGLLIGHESLIAERFLEILQIADSLK